MMILLQLQGVVQPAGLVDEAVPAVAGDLRPLDAGVDLPQHVQVRLGVEEVRVADRGRAAEVLQSPKTQD